MARRDTAPIKPCPHAASCFECPLPDCAAGTVRGYNDILTESFMAYLLPEPRREARAKAKGVG